MKNTSLTARLRAWLNNIPVQDPLDRHIASLLQIVLIGLIIVIILATLILVTIPTLSFQEKINVLISDLFGVLVVGLPLILLRRGYFRASALIIIIILFITPTLAIIVVFDLLNSGGILFQFTLAILLAGLLLSRSALALTFGLSAVVVGFSAFRGQNIAPQLAIANLEMAVNFILFNGLIALFLDRFGVTLRSALKMALERESELKNEINDRRQADEALAESEERYRKLINSARDVIFTISADGRITSLNPAFEIFTGWSRAEWLGRAFDELVTETDRTRAQDQFNRILRGETLRAIRLHMHTRAGEILIVEVNISPQLRDDQIVGLLGVARDMTQEQHAEDALKASEKRYRHIFDAVPVSIWEEDFSAIKLAVEELRSQGVTDFRGYLEEHPEFVQTSLKMLKVVDVNDMTLKLYGIRDKHELFAVIDKIFEMENLESFREELIALAEERTYFEGEVLDRTLQGEPLYLWRTIVFPNETAEFNSVLVCLIDITRLKQVEEALRASEDLRRLIIDTEPECVKLIAPNGSLMEMNTAGLAMIEADSLEQVKGAMLVEIVAPEYKDAFYNLHQRVLAGESGILEFEIIGLKGTRRWLETHAVPLRNQAGQIETLLGVTRDITERKHAEEALQKAHAELEQLVQERTVALSQANTLLQTMLDHTPDHVFFKDLQSRFIRNSKSQADMLGLSDPSQVIGKTDFDFFPHAQRAYDEEQSIIRSGRPMMDFEEHVIWPDGRETWVSTTKVPMRDLEGKIIGTFGIARDITDRKRAEEALWKAKDELEIRVTERTAELKQANEQLLIELNARKQAEEEVLLSQRRLTGLVTSAMDGIVSIDSQQKIVLFNPAAEKMFGYKAEELLGQSLGLILPERYRTTHTLQIDHFSKTGITSRMMTGLAEVTGVNKNGKEFPMDVSISQVDVGGQKLLTAIMRDITERKRAEKLQESVYEIARAAMTTQTLDELYAKIQAVLQNLLPAQYFYIALYDREKDLLSFPYFQDAFDVPSLPGKPGRGLTEYVLRTGKPLLATRETTDELIQSGQVELIGADSNEWLGVPLIVRDQAIGVMTVQSYEETIHFSAQDLEVMTYVSSQVASTIERKQAEALLQEAETRYRTLIEQLPIVVYINPASDISSTTYVSPQIQFLLGYTQEEWLKDQKFWQKALHPEDRPRVLDAVDRANQSGEPFDEEYRMIGRDGREVWIHDQGILLRDVDGQPLLWQGLMADITERKRTEDRIQRQNQRLKVLREIDTAILAADSVETIIRVALDHVRELIDCQRASLALIDRETNEVLIYDVRSIHETSIPLGTRIPLDLFQEMFQTVSKNQPVLIDDLTALREPPLPIQSIIKDGLRSLCILPLFSQSTLIGTFSMSSVITDFFDEDTVGLGREVANQVAIAITQANLLEALRGSNAELERRAIERERLITELSEKNAELERFTYTVSHDLKSPLVTIKGFLGYLEQDTLSGNMERVKSDTQRIARAVEKMQELLHDLLELSRIGRFLNPLEMIPFEELTRAAMDLVDGRLKERNVTVQIQPNLPSVYVDRQRLIEVLQNLLDNAAKYMGDQPEPRIEIGSQRVEDGVIVFYVKDNGIGIAPEYRDQVFGLFNKLDARTEGTGIGLALVKRIIEFHGGRIWVESEAGIGSTFYFTLPRASS